MFVGPQISAIRYHVQSALYWHTVCCIT